MPTAGTILVIDEEEIVREVARAILLSRGYDVLLAESGEAAVRLMRDHSDEISVALLDVAMTGLFARNTVASLLAINPRLAVVVSSGFSAKEALATFEPDHVSGFVRKPYTAARLSDAIGQALQARCLAA